MYHRPLMLLSLLLLLLTPLGTYAETYWVATNGNNGNSCGAAQSQNTPKATITNATGCMTGGDTLILRCGTYNQTIDDTIPNGSPAGNTIVRAETKGCAILRPNNKSSVDGYSLVILGRTQDRSYITLDGLVVDGSNTSQGMGGIILTVQGPFDHPPTGDIHHITVQNCEIRNLAANYQNWSDSNAFMVTGHQNTLRNNAVHDIGNNQSNNPGDDFAFPYGIYFNGDDHVIENNEWYRIAGYTIHMFGASDTIHGNNPMFADRNIFRNNYVHDAGTSLFCGGHSNHIYNNIFANIGRGLIGGGPSPFQGGLQIGGYCDGNSSGENQVYNNTIWHSNWQCISLSLGGGESTSNNIIRNNICYQNDGGDGIFQNAGGSGNVQDHNLLGPNPLFANTGAADFHLNTGSPAINTGLIADNICTDGTPTRDGANRCQGNIDMGALEGSGTVIQPLPQPTNLRLVP